MRDLRGGVALVTGASSGLGVHIARALAGEGMDVAVSGRREDALAEVAAELRTLGVRAEPLRADLTDHTAPAALADRVEEAIGPVDVLVNNAGVEITSAFDRYEPAELEAVVALNLTAPMLLTHSVLPSMLGRGRGHVVFISSLAGKYAPPFQAPYAATKAGLLRLTQSLRIEYADRPVGFSAVCPGFTVGGGMYDQLVEEGLRPNRLMGETTADRVVAGVLRAIRRDRPVVIETGAPVRPLLALGELAPRLPEWLAPRTGVSRLFGSVAAGRGRRG
jgi:short-subunit dehydrogenase